MEPANIMGLDSRQAQISRRRGSWALEYVQTRLKVIYLVDRTMKCKRDKCSMEKFEMWENFKIAFPF